MTAAAGQGGLDPKHVKQHQQAAGKLGQKVKGLAKKVNDLAKATPPSDPALKKRWDQNWQKLGKAVKSLEKGGGEVSKGAGAAQKALPKPDQKAFQAVGKGATGVSKGVADVAKSILATEKKLNSQRGGASGGGRGSDDKKTLQMQESVLLETLNLQMTMDKYSQAMQMMSNVSKKSHDSAMKIIGNIR